MFVDFNGFYICVFIEVFLMISFLIFAYISIRKVFIQRDFDIKILNDKLALIMMVAGIISSLVFFISYCQIREPIDFGNYPGTGYTSVFNYYFNLFYLFSFELSEIYIFRIVAIALYVLTFVMSIKGYKKNNYKLSLISLFIGIIANAAIMLDYPMYQGDNISGLGSNVTITGILTMLISLGIGIYQIIYKKKHIE